MFEADPEPVRPGLAPKLAIILDAPDEANDARAQQCSSIVARTADGSRAKPLISAVLRIDGDLDARGQVIAAGVVRDLAHRVRWKTMTATVEATAETIARMQQVPGIVYLDVGQTLRRPTTTDRSVDHGPVSAMRRVSHRNNEHRDGEDVLVGIIDVDGFDFAHPDFRHRDGGTRWEAIWDQGGTTRPPPTLKEDTETPSFIGRSVTQDDDRLSTVTSHLYRESADGTPQQPRTSPLLRCSPLTSTPNNSGAFEYGSLILKRHMDAAIAASPTLGMPATALEPQSQMVPGSHGTHVASIAAGNRGVARRARIAGVLIDMPQTDREAKTTFYDSTRLTDALDFLVTLASDLGTSVGPLPISINISLGTNGHAHDSSSLTAQWVDDALSTRGRCICVASGNSGQVEPIDSQDQGFVTGRIHAGGTLLATDLRQDLGWVVAGDENFADVSENEMEIWYSAQDRFEVSLRAPGDVWSAAIKPGQKALNRALANGTVVSIVNETYYPTNGLNRITILLSPVHPDQRGRIAPGIWTVRLKGIVVRDGRFDAWIERDDARRHPGSSRIWDFPSYFAPGSYTDDRMISSLGCSDRVLAVANVDTQRDTVHVSSSRGPTRDGRFKPDIGADGTDVVAARGFDRHQKWTAKTGTSMASPHVCGVAALMLAMKATLTPAQISGIIRGTSTPLIGHSFGWRKDSGFGLIDAQRCIEEVAIYKAAGGP